MNRRRFLKHGSMAIALLGGIGNRPRFIFGSKTIAFANTKTTPLPIPPLLEDFDSGGKTSGLLLTAQKGEVEFFQNIKTPTLGYNSDFLGPTIRVRNGQRLNLKLANSIDQTTTLHWHGLHVPAKWDGGPRQPVPAGDEWRPSFTINQQAATLWYHPHAMGLTGEQVYRGLAGLFIIEDEVSDSLKIPHTYGVDDIPLIIQDRRFYEDGRFGYRLSMHDVVNGVIGNYLLVNGVIKPSLSVPKGLVRFRILNGSNGSVYRIGFNDNQSFHIIASDGGILEHSVAVNKVVLTAGERVEILVDYGQITSSDKQSLIVEQYGGNKFEAMTITGNNYEGEVKSLTPALRSQNPPSESEATRVRRFVMETMGGGMGMGMRGGRLTINGKRMSLDRVDEKVKAGSVEIWEISNRSGMMMQVPHSMHLHDVQFYILSRDNAPPEPHELGRKDTVLVMPNEVVRILVPFGEYKGIYMYHCHMLEHEDDGMMGQFEVI